MLDLPKKIFTAEMLYLTFRFYSQKNLNLPDQNKHEMIYILEKECIPADIYQFIYKEEYF